MVQITRAQLQFVTVFLLFTFLSCDERAAGHPQETSVTRAAVADNGPKSEASSKRPTITQVEEIPDSIHEAMQSRSYLDAVKLIETELQNDDAGSIDYLLYLKGTALSSADRRRDALNTFLDFEQRYPNSEWISRSRFGRAAIAVKNRQYNLAGEIYKKEAERLLSRDRKDELAKIYLEFADRFFVGTESNDPARTKQPDFQQAVEYYREANKLGPTIQRQQEIEFRIARCLEELDQLDQAIAAYQTFLADHGSKRPASGKKAKQTLRSDAAFRHGLCQLKNSDHSSARRTFEDFLAEYSQLKNPSKPLRNLLASAKYYLAHTYGIPTPNTIGDLELGVSLAEQFLAAHPNHELAAKAELEIAQAYEKHRRNVQAVDRLESLIANPRYKNSDQLPVARRMLGLAYLAQNEFDKAIDAWKEFLDRHPTDSRWPEVQQHIISAEYAAAEHTRNEKRFGEARTLWQTFLNKYPLDSRAPSILFQFGEMNYQNALQQHSKRLREARQNGDTLDKIEVNQACRDLFENAITDWQKLVRKYPDSKEASLASLRIGTTLEDHLERRKEALESYKKVKGPSEAQAKKRMERLTSPELQVLTERKFGSDEDAHITLTTRNLEKVTVAVYSIDMTDYFRKMHLATGIEDLDIALINPDQQFEYTVEDYQPFKKIQQDVGIPLDHAGVTAVTVSSDKMEATTMVVVSDLDILVKSSRNELFLFAQNMRTGKPASNVSVLVSDGNTVFEELSTDGHGIARSVSETLKNVKDLRVFAVDQGHVASTVTNLNGLDFAVGLVPTGYLFTDRPVYRPGELVNIKGIVRWVEQDQFTFQKGERFDLDVYDPRGRLIKTESVALNAFGTIHTNLVLPESSIPGACRVHLHRPSTSEKPKLSFDSQFQVKQFKLEPVQISVDSEKSVFYRGEKLTATATVKYYYGAPLVNQTVQYSIVGENELHTAKTNDKGEVAIALSTRRFSEDRPIAIQVNCPDRNVQTTHIVFLATRGFVIDVTTNRRVYIAGETFDTKMKVTDPTGQPIQTPLTVQLFEVTNNGISGRGERLIRTHQVESNKETGEVKQTLQIDRGGRYLVRVSGTDQFENTVSGQTRLNISGDDDSTRLRILADQHHYKVGDEATVRLHWREAPALALITFDGASVLGHQLVSLQRGENKLKIPMQAHLAPNFFLSANVMQRERFHQTASEFTVAKDLQIELTPNKTTIKPTDRVKVAVKVTDASGRPVAAELALALVQSNLIERFPSHQKHLASVFSDGLRQRRIRQTSSCTFRYSTKTQSINEALLQESERLSARLSEAEAWEDRFGDQLRSADHPVVIGFDGVSGLPGLSEDAGGFGYQVDRSGDQQQMMGGMAERGFASTGGSMPQDADLYFEHQGGRQQFSAPASGLTPRFGVDFEMNFATGVHDRRMRNQLSQSESAYAGAEYRAGNHWTWGVDNRNDELMLKSQDFTINSLTADGRVLVINGMLPNQVAELTRAGNARIVDASLAGETGFWDPVVMTNADGTAEIEMTMPAKSTAWKLTAKAISADTLSGMDTKELVTRKPLFGQLTVPGAFTVGDKATIDTEVHSALENDQTVNVTLRTTMGDQTLSQKKRLKLNGPGIKPIQFPIEVIACDEIQFELIVTADEANQDINVSTAKVLPYGFPVFQTASGSASQNTLAMLQLSSEQKTRGQSLELLIGGDLNQALLDSMLDGQILLPTLCQSTDTLNRNASDCLGGVALLKMIRDSNQNDTPQAMRLSEIVSGAVGSLIASQHDDGGWAASGLSSGTTDGISTARVMWALAQSRQSGFAVSNAQFQKGIAYLRKAFGSETNLNRQAVLLATLSQCDAGDFALANRLYRERNRLDAYGLVQLMLALTSLNHDEMANELVPLVNPDAPRGPFELGRTSTETAAIELIVLQRLNTQPDLREKLAQKLLAARVGSRWTVETENGPAIAALAAHYGSSPPKQETIRLTIFVNGDELDQFTLEPGQSSHRVRVPETLLVDTEQKIEFELEGRGTFSYSAVLTGFADAETVKSTTKDWSVRRRYEPDEIRFDGKTIPRGHRVINGSYTWSPNKLTQLTIGDRGIVTLSPRVRYQNSQPLRNNLVLIEPIPAGCRVLEESVSGAYDRFEITPGTVTFYINDTRTPGDIRYTLAGSIAGTYRSAPTVLRNYHAPSEIAVGKPGGMTVLPKGKKTTDEYKLTPDELFALGKAHFAKDEFRQAYDHLTNLYTKWRLDPDPFKETVTLLFRSAMRLDDHSDTVKYFEVIKERFPDVELSFEEILTVAASYREIAEYERSYLVYRATVQGSFEKENQVAGFLNTRGEFLRSVETMESLLRDYPAESYVATASYALAQEVYRRAETARKDTKLADAGVTRIDLIDSSIKMLDDFVTHWPEDPSSDQASFALATALIDLEQYRQAIERGRQYAVRYPDSRLLDSFWYIMGFCYFELQDHQRALEMCQKVATANFKDHKSGATRPADNKWEAIYIMGQIHHSLGQAANAIDEYAKVSDRFKDAAEAIEFFSRKSISLPDVTTLMPDDDAEILLKHRNLDDVHFKVYRIDLMKFGLTQRNLNRITAINLAGIQPYHQETIALGDGKDYRDRETQVSLPLKEQGAYLVVCRGNNLYSSGLVVVSPLSLTVEEDKVSGRVRVSVKDKIADSFVSEVHVKVIGSENDQFESGQTDLRGLFVADAIKGTSTVIAVTQNDQYAFHRGTVPMLQSANQKKKREVSEPAQMDDLFGRESSSGSKSQNGKPLLDNLFRQNSVFQEEQRLNIDGLMNNGRQGIQSKEAY